MNRHITCVRVTTQGTTMSHFLSTSWTGCIIRCCLHAVSVHSERSAATICGSALVYVFSASMPRLILDLHAGEFLAPFCVSSPCLCLRGCLEDGRMSVWASALGGVSARSAWGATRGQRARRAPWLADVLSRQLASLNAHRHKHRHAHAQREGSC